MGNFMNAGAIERHNLINEAIVINNAAMGKMLVKVSSDLFEPVTFIVNVTDVIEAKEAIDNALNEFKIYDFVSDYFTMYEAAMKCSTREIGERMMNALRGSAIETNDYYVEVMGSRYFSINVK